MSLLEVTREEDGVTIELPPSVLRFLSANTELPELLDLFLPVVAADGSGNLDTEETRFPEDIPVVEALDCRGAVMVVAGRPAISWLDRTLFGGNTPGLVPKDRLILISNVTHASIILL